jgi:hypothetical protein
MRNYSYEAGTVDDVRRKAVGRKERRGNVTLGAGMNLNE